MSCHDAREQFSALLDNALDAGERAALDAHLATCADCRRELQRFRDTVALVRAAAPVRAPAGFIDRVLEAARPVPWPRRLVRDLFLPWPVKLPLEAAAIVLVAVGVALVYRGSPELEQSVRQEPAAPVVTRAPSDTPPEAKAPAPAREKEDSRELYGARREKKAGEQTPAPSAPQPAATSRDANLQKAPERQDRQAPVIGKLEAPVSGAERQRAAKDDVRSGTTQPTERRADSLKAQRPASAPPTAASPSITSAFVPPDVSGQLAVSDRELALRSLKELAARLRAVETRRFDTSDGPIIELAVARETYAELNRGLARLGRWQPGKEPSTLPATIRVVVRITG
jgi:putative zinc finger protein